MKLEYYTNNGYDSVVLVDDNGNVVGAWSNEGTEVEEFFKSVGGDPSDWDANGDDWRPDPDIDTLVATIEADGTLLPVDAELMAARCEFLGITV